MRYPFARARSKRKRYSTVNDCYLAYDSSSWVFSRYTVLRSEYGALDNLLIGFISGRNFNCGYTAIRIQSMRISRFLHHTARVCLIPFCSFKAKFIYLASINDIINIMYLLIYLFRLRARERISFIIIYSFYLFITYWRIDCNLLQCRFIQLILQVNTKVGAHILLILLIQLLIFTVSLIGQNTKLHQNRISQNMCLFRFTFKTC